MNIHEQRGFIYFSLVFGMVLALLAIGGVAYYFNARSNVPAGRTAPAVTDQPQNLGYAPGAQALSVSSTSGSSPFTVTFTSLYGGPTASPPGYKVDFGDGSIPSFAVCEHWTMDGRDRLCDSPVPIEHTYASPGTYTAKLIKVTGGPDGFEQVWMSIGIWVSSKVSAAPKPSIRVTKAYDDAIIISYANLPAQTATLVVCGDVGSGCTEWSENFKPVSADGTYMMTDYHRGLLPGKYRIMVLGAGGEQIVSSPVFTVSSS